MHLFCPDYLTCENLALQNIDAHKVTVEVSTILFQSLYPYGLFEIQPFYHKSFDWSALIYQKIGEETNLTKQYSMWLKWLAVFHSELTWLCFTIKAKSPAMVHLLSEKRVCRVREKKMWSRDLPQCVSEHYVGVFLQYCYNMYIKLPLSCLHVTLYTWS